VEAPHGDHGLFPTGNVDSADLEAGLAAET
jgi:hypothetical protein